MIAQALLNLADIAICVSNDFHLMHHNYKDTEFDNMHKKVLQKYYDQAAEDADLWSEAAVAFGEIALNYIEAGKRINWSLLSGMFNYQSVVSAIDKLLETYLAALLLVYSALDNDKCYLSVGTQNTVQTAIEYWSKEKEYFNARRQS